MSRDRISKKAGWVSTKALPKGPNGRALCRGCDDEVPRGRRTWCGDECIHQHRLTTDPAYVRSKLFERDKGVCAVCRLDTVAYCQGVIRRHGDTTLLNLRNWSPRAALAGAWARARLLAKLRRLGLSINQTERVGWRRGCFDADHIVPVALGGGGCDLEGYSTLCVPCHRRKTADQALLIARRRNIDVGQIPLI